MRVELLRVPPLVFGDQLWTRTVKALGDGGADIPRGRPLDRLHLGGLEGVVQLWLLRVALAAGSKDAQGRREGESESRETSSMSRHASMRCVAASGGTV